MPYVFKSNHILKYIVVSRKLKADSGNGGTDFVLL